MRCCSGHEGGVHPLPVCRLGLPAPTRPLRRDAYARHVRRHAHLPSELHAGEATIAVEGRWSLSSHNFIFFNLNLLFFFLIKKIVII